MNYRTRRHIQFVFLIGIAVALMASLFSLLVNEVSLRIWLRGLFIGALIGFPAAIYSLFVAEGGGRQLMKRLNFPAALLLNSTVYTCLILIGRGLGYYWMSDGESRLDLFPGFADPLFTNTLIFAITVSIIINLSLGIGSIVGNRILLKFLSGAYHTPREETRLFCFADLVGSSAIAEKIGNRQYLRLLDDLFREMTEPILRTRAEIYKYVGDEIIVSWPADRTRRALDFFFDIRRRFEARADYYEKEFGCRPEFRAGMHGGVVATGELGEIKKEIAFMGDALNVTARITELCKTENRPLLVSDTVPELFAGRDNYIFERLGERELRGKARPLAIFAVERR